MSKTNSLPEWNLSPFYASPTDPKLSSDMKSISKKYLDFSKKYRNKIKLLNGLEMEELLIHLEELHDLSGRVGSYVSLLSTTDTVNSKYNALKQKANEWAVELGKLTLFFGIEWKEVESKKANEVLKQIKNKTFSHYLAHLREYAAFTLKEEIEQVILEKDMTGSDSWVRLFTQLTSTLTYNVDKKHLTQSEVLALTLNEDREKRKQASEAVSKTLVSRKMEFSHIFNTLMTDKMIEEKRRNIPTWITVRNISNKVSDKIVNNLVKSVTSRYDIVSNHYKTKRKLLGLPKLFEYDRYAPINFGIKEEAVSWEEARKIVEEAYSSFNKEAGEIVKDFFEKGYIHAKLLPHKRGGAFCASTVSSVHPYILVNFTGKRQDVMTLAHELGHGMHQYLAGKNQGNIGLGMPLTTQEMVSTFGEMIVFTNLKNAEKDPKKKLALLTHKIDDIIATVFRQISMHCFEEDVHNKRRSLGELSHEQISEAWITTQSRMFKDSVTLRNEYSFWWSYIPHFINTPGYVYSYAFGELLALSLFKLYEENKKEFSSKYMDLLKSGDSDYPVNLLKKVGVDISDVNFWNKGLKIIEAFVKEEQKLADKLKTSL